MSKSILKQGKFRDNNKNNVDDRLDWITNACAIILPLTTIDQLKLIYIDKITDGVSALTWFLYGALTIPLFYYCLVRKDKPMIILNGLWIIIDWSVWIGVLIYR